MARLSGFPLLVYFWSACLWTALCIPAFAQEILKWADSHIPDAKAVAQSNAFALGEELSEPILDGWQHEGFQVIIDQDGRFDGDYCASLVVDRQADAPLRQVISQAQQKFAGLPPEKKARAITEFAHSLFTPADMTDDELSDWDDAFGNEHRGERILLGEYLSRGRGVCEQEAVLTKLLADDQHLPCTLIFGFDGNVGHVWTTMMINGKELVYDPAQELIAVPADAVAGHKTIRKLYGRNFARLKLALIANQELASGNWTLAKAHFEQLVQLDRQALGKRHPAYAVALQRLAALQKQQGDYEDARQNLLQALKICTHVWGGKHQEVADCANSLANVDRELGLNKEAEVLLTKSIAIYERTFGKDDVSVADPLYNLADLYKDEGRSADAHRLFTRALSLYQHFRGTQCADAQDTRNKLEELEKYRHKVVAGQKT